MTMTDRVPEPSKMPAPEAERLFLGRLLQQPSKLLDVKLTEHHFAGENHKQIFEAMRDLEAQGKLIDTVSVDAELKRRTGRQWLPVLVEYQMDSFTESFFESSQSVILDEYRKREIRKIAHDMTQELDPDAAIQRLMALNDEEKQSTFTTSEAVMQAIEDAKNAAQHDGVPGIATGLKLLDDAIGGFQAPDLIVIGARPAMGKTSVILNMMINHDCPVGFFSTEQPHNQVGLRCISMRSGVSARKIRTARFDDHEMNAMTAVVPQLASKRIFIHDKGVITIQELMREARRMKYNHDIQILYVDYIQRIRAKAESRRLEVAEVVIGLKSLAKELDIPVIALGQVNRDVDKRPDKRPRMGDMAESSIIESESDAVMLLYRDEVYNEDSLDKGVIEILIDKNRHGPIGRLKFAWLGESMQIKNLVSAVNF